MLKDCENKPKDGTLDRNFKNLTSLEKTLPKTSSWYLNNTLSRKNSVKYTALKRVKSRNSRDIRELILSGSSIENLDQRNNVDTFGEIQPYIKTEGSSQGIQEFLSENKAKNEILKSWGDEERCENEAKNYNMYKNYQPNFTMKENRGEETPYLARNISEEKYILSDQKKDFMSCETPVEFVQFTDEDYIGSIDSRRERMVLRDKLNMVS